MRIRRPATPADLTSLMEFYQAGRSDGGSFDDGIEAVLQRVLADPEFVYRLEPEPAGLAAGKSYRISDLALASRLSFFLWSSVPDDRLDRPRRARQAEGSGRARAAGAAHAGGSESPMRWSPTSPASGWACARCKASEPVVNLFPDFDDNLRAAYQREIELFFGSIVHEDRSILDLLTANYTFVNERLAKQYGIPNIYGPQFRRVTLPAELDMRRGLLGKGALLTVTSNAARTSPVARGKWFLQTFLGVSPPDPPPNVPAIKEKPVDSTGNAKAPDHARDHGSASHQSGLRVVPQDLRADRPGDGKLRRGGHVAHTGWRQSHRCDRRPGRRNQTGWRPEPARLAGALLRSVRTRRGTEKLLTYALGRGVEYQDMPMVRSIVRESAAGKYKFSSLVLGIVKSPAFQMNMKPAAAEVAAATEPRAPASGKK